MIADVEPLSGMRRYPSLSLGSSWERHTMSLQSDGLPRQGTAQHDMEPCADQGFSSPGLRLFFHCKRSGCKAVVAIFITAIILWLCLHCLVGPCFCI